MVDTDNNRIQKFTSNGEFLAKWDWPNLPFGIAADLDRNVYVADTGNNRIQRFAQVPLSTDTTAPVTNASFSPYNRPFSNSDITVYLETIDDVNGSGGKQITYEASGARQIAPTTVAGEFTQVTISASAVGETTITFYSTVRAGNVESPKSRTVTIDKTPPRVRSTMPKNLAREVRPGTPIEAVFSEPIRGGHLRWYPDMILYKNESTNDVEAQLTYDKQTKKATLDPDAPLQRGATYRAEISTSVRDLAGNNLDQRLNAAGDQHKVWRFTVVN